MVRPNVKERQVIWLFRREKTLCTFPEEVQDELGHKLSQIQRGEFPDDATILTEFGSNIVELKQDFATDTYRLVCAIGMQKGVYAIHAFMKKSKTGKSIPQNDKDIIKRRIKITVEEDSK